MTNPYYREYHPRWLRQRMSTYWWAGKWPYTKFILRELSSIFVAWFVIYLLIMVRAIARGADAWTGFVAWSGLWPVLLLNVIAFFFLMFHSLTWFAVAPQALVAHMGTKRVPPRLVGAAHYAAWVVVSAAVVWLLLFA